MFIKFRLIILSLDLVNWMIMSHGHNLGFHAHIRVINLLS